MLQDLEMLKMKHIELDHKIKAGHSNFIDDIELSKMKKQKLVIKERIEKLQGK
mgnify:FL=1